MQTAVAPARDGDVAIVQEFERLAAEGTIAAFELFIARNPQHPLAEDARRQIEGLGRIQTND